MRDDKEPRLQEITKRKVESEPGPDCGLCSLLCHSAPDGDIPDSRSPHFMTDREFKSLAAMRRLKEEASKIKNHMRQMDKQGMREDRMTLSLRLAALKEEWKEMDLERMDAAEERMRLLGHVQ